MELYFAERLRKYRKEKDMTQEALAQVIGVSPQSVSKWECGDGYPDITLLPGIANYFEVSIDELLGNDRISVQEDMHRYFDSHRECRHTDAGFALTVQYYHKYPKDFQIMSALASEIVHGDREKLAGRMPLLREVCERILAECTDTTMRKYAVQYMCMVCEERELPKWLKYETKYWTMELDFLREERYYYRKEPEKQRLYYEVNNLHMAVRLLNHRQKYFPDRENPEKAAAMYRTQLEMILQFGGGTLADGWICQYMAGALRLAEALFAGGKTDEGFRLLEVCVALRERWMTIPEETLLDLGNPMLFGDVRWIKGRFLLQYSNGQKGALYPCPAFCCYDVYKVLTAAEGWEGFDSVREDPRFSAILQKAEALSADEEIDLVE